MPNGGFTMMIELLDRSILVLLNKKIKYPLSIAEKDYFLALILKIIYDSSLKEKLIFKGGTALHHVYLPHLRFSEDLDFSTNQIPISLEELRNVFENYDFLTVKKEYISHATIKIQRLMFNGPLGQPNSLKIEIDFFQNVVLPAKNCLYHNHYGVKTKVRVMDIREIAAEKIRAMNDRIRYRDFYDFAMIGIKLHINFSEAIKLLKKKEIRKAISIRNILCNWELAKKEKDNEMLSIFCAEELADNDIEKQIRSLHFSKISTF